MLRTCLALCAALALTTATAQGLDGRLKKIADTKTITIAHRTDAAPFSFVDADKNVTGFSVDLCRRVVASLEKQLKVDKLAVKWVPVTTQTRFDAVAKGQADLECGASTVTLSRLKTVDFSSFIFIETTGLMAKAVADFKSLADMGGKKIAVIGGTTNERAVRAQLERRKVNATVVTVKSNEEGIAAVEAGTADAFASDALLLIGGAVRAKDPKALALLNDRLSYEPYGLVLPRGDYNFRLAVNTALSQIYSSEQIDDVFSRWFSAFGKPTPLTEAVYILGAIPE
ncbi:MAG: amino acid ABC transporter substrate-binding protein [Burkholderiales bacterium]